MRIALAILCLVTVPSAVIAKPTIVVTGQKADDSDAADMKKVICRREQVTGSLAGTRKICMTRGDWIASTRDHQDVAQRMQDAGHINPCGSACK